MNNTTSTAPRQLTDNEIATLAQFGFFFRRGVNVEQVAGTLSADRVRSLQYDNVPRVAAIDRLLAALDRPALVPGVLNAQEANYLRKLGVWADVGQPYDEALAKTRAWYNRHISEDNFATAHGLEVAIDALERRLRPEALVSSATRTLYDVEREISAAFNAGAGEVVLTSGDEELTRFANPHGTVASPPPPQSQSTSLADIWRVIDAVQTSSNGEFGYNDGLSVWLEKNRELQDALAAVAWFSTQRRLGRITGREAEFISLKNKASLALSHVLIAALQHGYLSGVFIEDVERTTEQVLRSAALSL